MKDLKIKVNSETESKEAQELLFELGCYWNIGLEVKNLEAKFLYVSNNIIKMGYCSDNFSNTNYCEITLSELRAMVHPMKEYLMPSRNYEYILTDAREALEPHAEEWIEIPEWANYAYKNDAGICFLKGELGFNHPLLIWKRPTQPEALPFIDDNPQSLNDQYAEIEQARQAIKDNVNHPSHYTKGKVECLDALESATIGKSGIEAVCVANIIKYLWRYEEKNGVEDVRKAQFYLNRLLATLENNNG